jgi:lipopolysaccharide export system protein LptA
MKIKVLMSVLSAAGCAAAFAETNVAAGKANATAAKTHIQHIEITSDTGQFDGKSMQMVYLGHVFVTDNAKGKLSCDRLVVDLPADGGHLTNIVAEPNVVIDYLDSKGQTNHITADRAVYAYSVVTNSATIITNEVVTFTGGQPTPKVENPQVTIFSDPLIYDVTAKKFIFAHYKTILNSKTGGNDTNGSPFNFLK